MTRYSDVFTQPPPSWPSLVTDGTIMPMVLYALFEQSDWKAELATCFRVHKICFAIISVRLWIWLSAKKVVLGAVDETVPGLMNVCFVIPL